MKPSAQHPTIDDITLPGIFYALGDNARLQIVRNIYVAKKPLTCSEAVEGIDNLPVSTRSHCFRALREAGLIRSQKQGRECFNSLRLDEIETRFPKLLRAILQQK